MFFQANSYISLSACVVLCSGNCEMYKTETSILFSQIKGTYFLQFCDFTLGLSRTKSQLENSPQCCGGKCCPEKNVLEVSL